VQRVNNVIRFVQSRIDSHDLVQAVFVPIVADSRAQRLLLSDTPTTERYFKTVDRNRLRDHIRRLKAAKRDQQRAVGADAGALAHVTQTWSSPSEIADLRKQVARVEA
jgi:hypothetical protein